MSHDTGLPGGDATAKAALLAAQRPLPDYCALPFSRAIDKLTTDLGISSAMARRALNMAGKLCETCLPADIHRAVCWADMDQLPASLAPSLGPKPAANILTDELRAFHRMAGPATPEDYTLQQDNTEFLEPLNCVVHRGCQNMKCLLNCCKQKGISVNFIYGNESQFYRWHMHLYDCALRPLLLETLCTKDGLSEADADAEVHKQYTVDNKIDVSKALDKIPKAWLPQCAIRQHPPEGMRVLVKSTQPKQRVHGLLQPLPRAADDAVSSSFSLLAYNEAAMTHGPGWLDCPFFAHAMARPEDITSFSPLPGAHPGLRAAVSGLERLQHLYIRRQAAARAGGSANDIFELSRLVVTLCEEPGAVTNMSYDVTDTHWTAEPALGRYLLLALEKGYINSTNGTYSGVINLVANSLSMDAAEVEARTQGMDPRPADDALPASLVLYGNVVPFNVDHGQTRDTAGAAKLNEELDNLLASAAGPTVGTPPPAKQQPPMAAARPAAGRPSRNRGTALATLRWERLEQLQQSMIVVETAKSEHRLPFADGLRHQFTVGGAVSEDTQMELTLASLADIFNLQTDDALLAFTHAASAPGQDPPKLKALIAKLQIPDQRRPLAGSQFADAAERAFRQQDKAVIACSAASVVAVINSNPGKSSCIARIKDVLDTPVIADFVVAYLSCRLRLKLAEAGEVLAAPLATRALMTLLTAMPDLESDLVSFVPGEILPPLPHHPVYVTTIDLNRQDVSHALGILLALEIKEGLLVARAALGYRSSFMVWFVDGLRAFDLAAAIHREHGQLLWAQAQEWAARLVVCGQPHFAAAGLKPCVVPADLEGVDAGTDDADDAGDPTGLVACTHEAKRLLVLTWNRGLHERCVPLVQQMLDRTGAAIDNRIAHSLVFSGLESTSPTVAAL